MNRLRAKLVDRGLVVAGVLSGTSADGIDVAIVEARVADRDAAGTIAAGRARLAPPALRAFETVPFSRELHARVRAALDGGVTSFRECALFSRDLGRAFGRAARDVASAHGLALDLVGSHGQTVYHHDGAEESGAATLQLGDGDHVAEEAGVAVVSDFRQRDVAAGGEGAPLSALADDLVFARAARPCAILNLGGMANLTLLGDEADDVLAFDTGPANALLDGLARRLVDRPFDRDGDLASGGRAEVWLVRELAAHPFLAKPPPRSTGRDTFGEAWIDALVERARGARSAGSRSGAHAHAPSDARQHASDLMATAVAFVAWCVADSLARFAPRAPRELLVAGGGVHNRALIAAIERASGCRVVPSDAVGVPADAREGIVFAVLAARFVLGVPLTRPSVTGARAGRLLGKFSPGAVASS